MKQTKYILLFCFLLCISSCNIENLEGEYFVTCLTSDFKGIIIKGYYRISLDKNNLLIENDESQKEIILDTVEIYIEIKTMELMKDFELEKVMDRKSYIDFSETIQNEVYQEIDKHIVKQLSVKVIEIESINRK